MSLKFLNAASAKPLRVVLVALMAAVGASAPIAAHSFPPVLSVSGLSSWLLRFAGGLVEDTGSVPPWEIGTCIDPSGKPKPCPVVNSSGPRGGAKPTRGTPEV